MNITTKYILITISINLLVAFLILTSIVDFDFLSTFKFIYDLKLNLFIGIFGLYFSGYLTGNKLNKLKNNKGKLKLIYGVISIFFILILGTFIGSSIGFIEEGLPSYFKYGHFFNCLFDYYFKPFYWIMLFGFIPTLLSGIILGYKLKKLNEK